jgi:hypothetical protein
VWHPWQSGYSASFGLDEDAVKCLGSDLHELRANGLVEHIAGSGDPDLSSATLSGDLSVELPRFFITSKGIAWLKTATLWSPPDGRWSDMFLGDTEGIPVPESLIFAPQLPSTRARLDRTTFLYKPVEAS